MFFYVIFNMLNELTSSLNFEHITILDEANHAIWFKMMYSRIDEISYQMIIDEFKMIFCRAYDLL